MELLFHQPFNWKRSGTILISKIVQMRLYIRIKSSIKMKRKKKA